MPVRGRCDRHRKLAAIDPQGLRERDAIGPAPSAGLEPSIGPGPQRRSGALLTGRRRRGAIDDVARQRFQLASPPEIEQLIQPQAITKGVGGAGRGRVAGRVETIHAAGKRVGGVRSRQEDARRRQHRLFSADTRRDVFPSSLPVPGSPAIPRWLSCRCFPRPRDRQTARR